MKILSVFGTRPEAIKMCPLVKEMEGCPEIESVVCLTGQHREMLRQVTEVFGVRAAYNLNIMRPQQTPATITVDVLEKLDAVLAGENPDMVLVHGDTTTCLAAALAAFYRQLPVGHVEAGLRTHNKYSPFPEEMNRSLSARIAELHFCPTSLNARNLAREGIKRGVFVTGNTVIDAFKTTVKPGYRFKSAALAALAPGGKRLLTLTAHRRENWGAPLEGIFRAVAALHDAFEDIEIVYPLHPNPRVSRPAREILGRCGRVHLLEPLNVTDMHNLLSRSTLVMTDSGGLQEEAPAFGIPVLVLRTETERPEAVEAGTVKVVGVTQKGVYQSARALLADKAAYQAMAAATNPYGDGHASERIVRHLLEWREGRLPKKPARAGRQGQNNVTRGNAWNA